MTETNRERLARIRAEQDAAEALADAVQARVSPEEWNALLAFNTYCAGCLGLVLEFYQRTNGQASYRFRPATEEEAQERAEGWVEDHL